MKQSYKILSLFGIDIEVHWLFVLTILLFLILDPMTALFFAIVFVFVALHEVSHSIVAKKAGIKVKKIILLPIGGMAVIENIEELDPWSEIKMAFSGPLFNFIIAGICFLIAYFLNYPLLDRMSMFLAQDMQASVQEVIFLFVFYANVMLGLFNLLVPAFPLDGGRILRGILALKMDYEKATKWAKNVGIIFGIAITLWGFLSMNIFVGVIGIFIIVGANAEYQGVLVTKALKKIDLDDIITKEVIPFDPETPISEVVNELIKSRESSALILEDRVFHLSYLQNIPKQKWDMPISKISKKIPAFKKSDSIMKMVRKMSEGNFPFVLITNNRKILGVIYLDDIQKKLSLMSYGI